MSTAPAVHLPAAERKAARRAARRFLGGYLALLYGHGPAANVAPVTAALRTALRRGHSRVPPAARARHPRVTRLAVVAQTPRTVLAAATVNDGANAPYRIAFHLTRIASGWRVSAIDND